MLFSPDFWDRGFYLVKLRFENAKLRSAITNPLKASLLISAVLVNKPLRNAAGALNDSVDSRANDVVNFTRSWMAFFMERKGSINSDKRGCSNCQKPGTLRHS